MTWATATGAGTGGGGGGGIRGGIRGGGVPPDSPNPDHISDQNLPFSISVFQTWSLKSIPVFICLQRPKLCHHR